MSLDCYLLKHTALSCCNVSYTGCSPGPKCCFQSAPSKRGFPLEWTSSGAPRPLHRSSLPCLLQVNSPPTLAAGKKHTSFLQPLLLPPNPLLTLIPSPHQLTEHKNNGTPYTPSSPLRPPFSTSPLPSPMSPPPPLPSLIPLPPSLPPSLPLSFLPH